ncbi:MAG: class D sortase [Clostridiales bacterium]|jgi:sortase A|nr:class D sortase [Clostridiales bacterium]MCI2160782.1 class D sortase [Oscillospiraceae bacterium]MCI1962382.1 class D sortase [Clostridiales bacterium]MCI2022806.1 class D sortase [Clostridiales bacterium]MCI2027203.1 class D sortase [Clostridiales bacterium]
MIRKYFDKIKRHFDIILIFSGCIMIVAAISLKLYTQYEQKILIDNYRNQILSMKDQDSSFNQQKDNSNTFSAENRDNSTETSANQKQSSNLIGILSIPKIDLSVGIGEGVDKETLKYSVGHFIGTAMPGKKGNLCIAGHRSYTYGEFFNRLDEIQKNDIIIVENNGNTFNYKVIETKVVTPEEVSVLDQTKDSEITLVTCTPIRTGTHRLIVKGILME